MKLHTYTTQLLADTQTPVGLYLALRDQYRQPLLLESSSYNSRQGHYSYLCFDAIASVSLDNGTLIFKTGNEISGRERVGTGAEALLSGLQKFRQQFSFDTLPLPFCYAGLFGYTGYDLVSYTEELQFGQGKKQFGIPDLCYMVYRLILVFDHQNNSLTIVSHAEDADSAKEQAVLINDRIRYTRAREFGFRASGDAVSPVSDKQYLDMVRHAKNHCQLGDVFQLLMSRRFSQPYTGDDFNVYRALKNINPSPYLFYFDLGNFRLFGSSPEAQLIVRNGRAEIHPIAGTYRRTGDDHADLAAAQALLADPKENAEHTMLVDLARNDLSRYCSNVEVAIYKQTQFFSHVIHLVSVVTGNTGKHKNPFEILFGTFPAGTLCGAPKHRAMQLIDTYEDQAREFYGGCIGFISHDGVVNHAIMIRTFLSMNHCLYYQAGAGIVVHSNPESELNEVYAKVSALRKAIDQANTQ